MPGSNLLAANETTDLIRLEEFIGPRLESFVEVGTALLEIRDRKLYREHHDTFEGYCKERWKLSRSRAYELIDASVVNNDVNSLSATADKIPVAQTRALIRLPKDEREPAYREAMAATDGKPTAKAVREVVDRKLQKPPKAESPEDLSAIADKLPAGQSKVNGVLQPDPPEIARQRAAGRIAPNVVPEIETSDDHTTVEDVAADRDERKGKTENDLSDADWLAALPLHSKLSGTPLKTFEEDALYYRSLEPHRSTLSHHAARLGSKCRRNGAFRWSTKLWLKIDHPRRWVRCPDPKDGGCGGTGQLELIGGCPKCRERGYRVNNG